MHVQLPKSASSVLLVPKLLMKNRSANLSKEDKAKNCRALEVPLAAVVERAVAPLVDTCDCRSIARAVAQLVVKDAAGSATVLDILVLKLPLLQHIAALWNKLQVRAPCSALFVCPPPVRVEEHSCDGGDCVSLLHLQLVSYSSVQLEVELRHLL